MCLRAQHSSWHVINISYNDTVLITNFSFPVFNVNYSVLPSRLSVSSFSGGDGKSDQLKK